MRRKITPRKQISTFAFVVDGETEIWYLLAAETISA